MIIADPKLFNILVHSAFCLQYKDRLAGSKTLDGEIGEAYRTDASSGRWSILVGGKITKKYNFTCCLFSGKIDYEAEIRSQMEVAARK